MIDLLFELTLCNKIILFSNISATSFRHNWLSQLSFSQSKQKEPYLLNTQQFSEEEIKSRKVTAFHHLDNITSFGLKKLA